MNKNRFRVLFNQARGQMMVAAETAHSLLAAKTSRSAAPVHSPCNASSHLAVMRPLVFAVLVLSGNLLWLDNVSADIIADHSAPASQQPVITSTASGIPQVNIQTPSAAGVSRNTYSQFDVNARGAILNNARTSVQTQLGGFVQGNPALAAGTARVILNEVNSSNPSLLNGYVEVAGSRAQVVLANPAGIACDGCGFINANRATLTTGTPMINGGNLVGYRVGGGSVSFLGAGMDSSQASYTDIIARAVQVNAGVFANDLNIITGSNQVSIDSDGKPTGITSIAPDSTASTPAFAIDVAALGGMYAGKIHLVGTEAGLGVRNAGNIGASAGDVRISVDGQLINSGQIASTGHTSIDAQSVTNTNGTVTATDMLTINSTSLIGDGSLLSEGDIAIRLAADYTHTGELQANGNALIETSGNIINQARLLAGNNMELIAANIDNNTAGEINAANIAINVADTFTNHGLIDGSATSIQANSLINQASGTIFGDQLAIHTAMLSNSDAAVIAARERLDIGASDIGNRNNALLFSAGDLAVGGSLDADDHATGQAASLINTGSTIEALGNADLAVADLQNINTNLVTQVVVTGTGSFDRFTPRNQSVILDSADYPSARIGDTNVSTRIAGPYSFREYTRYQGSTTTTQTQIVTSQPGQILSGGNMSIAGNLLNSDSRIIAGGALNISGGSLQNLNTQGVTSTSYNGIAYYYDYDGSGGGFDYDIDVIGAYNPAAIVTTFNLATSALQQNTAPVGRGTTIAATAAPLPVNNLFNINASPAANYLIETDPRFADYRTWLSSDFMLQALSIDPALAQKRLGDGFYEQRLIREQITQLTGRRFLDGYASDEAQYQALMNAAVTYADALQLVPGIALSAAQIAQLTSDIVWLVTQAVTLPDGTVTQALVPQVYVKPHDGDLNPTTGMMAGNTVRINVSGDLKNAGTIAGRTLVALNAENINNFGGHIAADVTALTAATNINNIGGTIAAKDALLLEAGNDINLRSTTHSSSERVGVSSFSRTNLDRVAGLYVSNADAILVADAGNNVNLMAASISNSSANGITQINAGKDINLGTVTIAEQNSSIRNANNYVKHGGTKEVGTVVETMGAIAFTAGKNFNAKAATVNSESGAIGVHAAEDINIVAGRETSNFDTARKVKKNGTFSSKTKSQRDIFNANNSLGSSFSGDSVILQSGNDINVSGSSVVSDHVTTLLADHNINIVAAEDTASEFHERKTKKSGFSASGASISYGKQQLDTKQTSNSVSHTGSTLGSVAGNVNIVAGKQYQQTASDVIAPSGDVNITAERVDINAARNTNVSTQETKFKQSGITLAISNPVIDAAQTVQQIKQAASQTSNNRVQALAAGTAALTVKNAADAVIKGNQAVINPDGTSSTSNAAKQVGGINISLSIGSSKSSSKSIQSSSQAQGSAVMAGNDINLIATGAGANSDINVVGSQLNAGNNVALSAADQINLLAARNTADQHSKNKSSNASVGVSFGTSGLAVTASTSKGRGNADGSDVSWTESIIEGRNKTNLESGTDINLIGAQLRGKQVIANVGTSGAGNLNIQSLQDTSTYDSKQKSSGLSVSVPISAGTYGGSVNTSKSNINSDYASVIEQSGIYAGNDGFQINVYGNTHLTGAVIASTEQVTQNNQNSLITQTLTASDIRNKAEYNASSESSGIALSYDVSKSVTRNVGNNLVKSTGTLTPGLEANDYAASTTRSAISNGALNITNSSKQLELTGKDAKITLAHLNHDTSNANPTALARTDTQKIEQELAATSTITSIATAQVTQAINSYYQKRIDEYDSQYGNKLEEARALEAEAAVSSDEAVKLSLAQEAQLLRSQAIDLRNERDNPSLSRGMAETLGNVLVSGLGTGQIDVANAAAAYSVGIIGDKFLLVSQKRDSDIAQGAIIKCNAQPAVCVRDASKLKSINNPNIPLEERLQALEKLQTESTIDGSIKPLFEITLVDSNSKGITNVVINGIDNELDRALVLGIGHLRSSDDNQSIYLSYNDAQGGFADLLNAAIDKYSGATSNPSLMLAQALMDAGAHNLASPINLYAHSGGTLIGNIALNTLGNDKAFLPGLRVDYFGPASSISAEAAAALNAVGLANAPIEQKMNWLKYRSLDGVSPNDKKNTSETYGIGYFNHSNDPVATFVGGNFGLSDSFYDNNLMAQIEGAHQRDIVQSIREIHALFTSNSSAHSTYRWNDPRTWPVNNVVMAIPVESTP